MRVLLRAMNSYYNNRIEGQHTLPVEIEQALHHDYSADTDKARRQRLALAQMATEQAMEKHGVHWEATTVWSGQIVRDIHQNLFARLLDEDLVWPEGGPLQPGVLRDRAVTVGRHVAP